MAVGRLEIQPVAVHPHTTVADGTATVFRVLIMPELPARLRISRPYAVGRGEIQYAVHEQGRRLDLDRAIVSCKACGPGKRSLMNVCSIDLVQRAVSAPGVVDVI